MKIISALFSLIILALVLSTSGIAAPIKAKATHSKVSKVVSIEADQLPKGYAGDNNKIVEILKKSCFEKGEFETHEAYTKRKEAVEDKIYAFSYKPRRSDEHNGILKKELSYNIEENSLIINLERFKYVEKIWDDIKGSYNAQNAFGAKTIVTKGTRNRYNVKLPEENFEYGIKIEPHKAKRLIENIRFLYWVKLRDMKYESLTINPSRDNPFDGKYIECESLSIPVETWMYNFMTGEIYKKVKYEGAPAANSAESSR